MRSVYGPLSPNMAVKHTLHLLEISEDQSLVAVHRTEATL